MQSRTDFLTGAASVTLCSALLPIAARSAGSAVSIRIDTSRLGNEIGSGFAGLSYKKTAIAEPLFRPNNASLVKLFRLLGPSLLRVGGTAVDHSSWNAHGPGRTANQIAPADVDAFADFLAATGWKVLYGINLAQNTPANAADEAQYAARKLGASLYAFEIGNEPDQYHKQFGPPIGTYNGFRSAWETFASAIKSAAPGAALTGPATSHQTKETLRFARDEASRIVLLTQHYYRASGKVGSSTADLLLAPDPRVAETISELAQAASSYNIRDGFRVTECGSFAGGGKPGVSDAYASALWAVSYLFTIAQAGARGANFHAAGNGRPYDPIADDGTNVTQARPGYYGLLLFSRAGAGRLANVNVDSAPAGFSAYSIVRQSGGVSLVIVNAAQSPVQAAVKLDRTASRYTSLVLTGPSLSATGGVKLGAASVAGDGTWRPQTAARSVTNGALGVSVPPASAMLVELH